MHTGVAGWGLCLVEHCPRVAAVIGPRCVMPAPGASPDACVCASVGGKPVAGCEGRAAVPAGIGGRAARGVRLAAQSVVPLPEWSAPGSLYGAALPRTSASDAASAAPAASLLLHRLSTAGGSDACGRGALGTQTCCMYGRVAVLLQSSTKHEPTKYLPSSVACRACAVWPSP